MESRIVNGLRSFFAVNPTYTKRSAERDANGQQQQQGSQQRQPTEEEAKKALDALTKMEDVIKNGLCAELECVEGIFLIHVRNSLGASLRSIRGVEIFRLLETAPDEESRLNRGRILDRKI